MVTVSKITIPSCSQDDAAPRDEAEDVMMEDDNGSGLSSNTRGRFAADHPKMRLPFATESPRGQAESRWESLPAVVVKNAWRLVWDLAFPGFFLVASTGWLFGLEYWVQTVLASVFATIAQLLSVKLERESHLKGHGRRGRFEFLFKNPSNLTTLVVEVKQRLDTDYLLSLEQMYSELFLAWVSNCSIDEQAWNSPVWGVLMDGTGGVLFKLVIEDKNTDTGYIACSEYLTILDGVMPGSGMPRAFQYILQAVKPECQQWEEGVWRDAKDAVQKVAETKERQASRLADLYQSYYDELAGV